MVRDNRSGPMAFVLVDFESSTDSDDAGVHSTPAYFEPGQLSGPTRLRTGSLQRSGVNSKPNHFKPSRSDPVRRSLRTSSGYRLRRTHSVDLRYTSDPLTFGLMTSTSYPVTSTATHFDPLTSSRAPKLVTESPTPS